jgi:hypothetical protein
LSDALRPLSDSQEIQRTAVRVVGEHLQVDRALYNEIRGDRERSTSKTAMSTATSRRHRPV